MTTKKYDCVLAFGDSHVAGCELIDYSKFMYRSLIQADAYTKPLAFPALLAKKLNIPCWNFAMSAGSNARSLRKLYSQGSRYDNALVLFGYTTVDRMEFHEPRFNSHWYASFNQDEDGWIQTGHHFVATNILHVFFTLFNQNLNLHPLTRDYHKHSTPVDVNQQIFYVEAACLMQSFTCIHLPLFPEEISIRPRHLFDFEHRHTYVDWCESRGFVKLPGYHYGHEAHRSLASLLYEYVQSL
jgi:hypothetical protein